MTLLLIGGMAFAQAQKQAEIKFDKVVHNFGTFTDKEPVQECTFTFTNVGEAPLVINQAVASCGPITAPARWAATSRNLSPYARMVRWNSPASMSRAR